MIISQFVGGVLKTMNLSIKELDNELKSINKLLIMLQETNKKLAGVIKAKERRIVELEKENKLLTKRLLDKKEGGLW